MTQYTKIMVFGTFDILHKGHISFFKQARGLSKKPFLIVSVARDKNAAKIKKYIPINSEKTRLKNIRLCKLVNKSVLGGIYNHIPHIVKEQPNIIALGYDQKIYTKNLKNDLAKCGLKVKVIRLKPFKPNIYKSRIINENRHRSRAGK